MSDIITLKENRDFSRLYKKGKCIVSPVLVTYILKNKTNNLRFGITTGKKIGNAVKRSRSRRVIRVSFRNLSDNIKTGYDFVFVARGKTPFVKSYVVEKAMKQALVQAGIFKEGSV
ncbi:MAG: ribonuclease P protein component [Ruminococcus sp.]